MISFSPVPWRRWPCFFVCIVALSWAVPQTPTSHGAGLPRVVRVFDGDTIQIQGTGRPRTVRLAAIDAPEKSKAPGEPGQAFAERSKAFLSNLVYGKPVRLESFGPDRYGRILAVVYCDGKNVNLEMVREGLAEVYRGKLPERVDKDIFFSAEKKARQGTVGMWRQGSLYESPYSWKVRHRK